MDPVLWIALHDNLQILREQLEDGRPHTLRIILGSLRALVSDKSQGVDGGLLNHLAKISSYHEKIGWMERDLQFNDFLNYQIGSIYSDLNSTTLSAVITVTEFIQKESQTVGLAHEDIHYEDQFGHALRSRKTNTMDEYRGVVMHVALVVLYWGENFYNRIAPKKIRI